jgi:transcriptional regulator with XRE-family HTH domain
MAIDGARVRALRELKGIRTQQALADIVKVAQSSICDLEKGKRRNDDVFLRVADELDCTTDFLFRRGPFKDADDPDKLQDAASRMAFDCFVGSTNIDPVHRERCARVLGHPEAPVTAKGWKALAEMIDLAIGPQLPIIGLATRAGDRR